jgi:hypothetical protein
MQMLHELANYIRSTLPLPQAILQLRINERANGVTFIWEGVEFFVSTSLKALELRGNTLYMTGLSILLESVLADRKDFARRCNQILDQLSEAETMLRSEPYSRAGAESLRDALRGVQRLS